ncbi:MAG: hypothetical protein O2826_07455 [Chloroflexi bacterium]|nr:hypothetical protein [Chloroflexota bacterium]MDA1174338.1 hypothetical protein [Chloroflexota bacterium]
MKRVNLIKGGVVVNSISMPDEWTGEAGQWQPPDGEVAVADEDAGIGYTYDGTVFTKPDTEADGLLREWEAVMVASDSLMTRDVEDLIDTLLVTEVLVESQLPTKLSDARIEKKTLRGSKPA